MKAAPCILLTRPTGASNRLESKLSQRGYQTLACPTLRTETLPAVAADFAIFKDANLIFFVSGSAVRAFAEQLDALDLRMDPAVSIAAVGKSTAAEIERLWGRSDVLLPLQGQPEDTESLWSRLAMMDTLPQSVLIVRGQTGREWFAQQLRKHGCRVLYHAAYCRRQATWDSDLVVRLKALAQGSHLPVFVCTSQEGITALASLLNLNGLYSWSRAGHFVVTHPRHVDALADQFHLDEIEKNRRITLSDIHDNAILKTLESVCKVISCD